MVVVTVMFFLWSEGAAEPAAATVQTQSWPVWVGAGKLPVSLADWASFGAPWPNLPGRCASRARFPN